MIPLVIVRPEPGATATLKAAQALKLGACACPIFAVEAVAWQPVPRERVDALLLGSANALRHGGPGLETLHGLPAYCVGETTAAAAREAGLAVAGVGRGGLQHVLEAIGGAHRRLLRLAGAAHVPLCVPPGTTVETRIVYAAVALPPSSELREALRRPAVVMLHSAEAAAHFATICPDNDRPRLALATIGPRVASAAGEGWARVRTAAQPSDAALLALAREMCQDGAGVPISPDERPDAGR